jgi:dUTP pyrophosphatase
VKIELQILDPRLPGWGFPSWGSSLAAGVDLHACLDSPLVLEPQAPAVLISAGIAFRIGAPEWCALVLPRSGLGHREGLVLGNAVGLIDADYEGPCLISAWNRNPRSAIDGRPSGSERDVDPPQSGAAITIRPGDRIAQLVFTRIARPQFTVVSRFSESGGQQGLPPQKRGAGGLGSTGVEAACRRGPAERNS